jgi:hypothetical protein
MRRGQIFVIICLALYLNQINGWSYDNGAQICANTDLGSPLDLKSTLYCGEEEHWRRFELNFNISTAVEYTHTLDNFHNVIYLNRIIKLDFNHKIIFILKIYHKFSSFPKLLEV